MAQGDSSEILEQGDIFFMYRPKVEQDEVGDIDDVQRFYVALKPDGEGKYRLLVVGRKHLPDVPEHERAWAYVDAVATDPKDLEQGLRAQHYRTKTRGLRSQPAARPAGEGRYAIVKLGTQMHLAYALELPHRPGTVQQEFNIAPEASFAISIKNPAKGRSLGLPEEQKAEFPAREQKKFRGRRFDREDAELLDYPGAEIVLVGARRNPERRYDIDLHAQDEDLQTADIIKKLRLAKSRHPVEPLIRGEWR